MLLLPLGHEYARVGAELDEFAAGEARDVKHMRRQIAHNARGGIALVEAPFEPAAFPQAAVFDAADVDVVQLAQRARRDFFPHQPDVGAVMPGKADVTGQAARFGRVADSLDLGIIHAHGLFDAEGQIARRGFRGNGAVHIIGRGDIHGVDQTAGHQIAIIGKAGALIQRELHAHPFKRQRVRVAQGGDFRPLRSQIAGNVRAVHDAAHADESYAIDHE